MTRSAELIKRARRYIPGGVNSPVRAFNGVGGDPVFIEQAQGPFIFDVDGKRYIDYVGSWGPMIAGHAHPKVLAAINACAKSGTSFGAPTELEVRMAQRVCELMPAIETVRMVNSGTEATMSALRLARGFTGRDKIVKFTGCYHGHGDALLVQAGSGALTLGVPSSPGVPADLVKHTLTLPYNDLTAAAHLMEQFGEQLACVIVEPIAGNMNCVPPVEGFLSGLRSLCDRYGILLIFDEVMTGFRVALGGAQALYQITPDLTTLGKVIGGGLPVAAFGGKREIMEHIAPVGPVYQAGTLSGNPLAMSAGLAMLDIITEPGFFETLDKTTAALTQGIQHVANQAGLPLTTHQVGGMFGIFFSDQKEITQFSQVANCDIERFKAFFHAMLERGIYFAPSAYEAGFVSSAHSKAEIDATLDAATDVFAELG